MFHRNQSICVPRIATGQMKLTGICVCVCVCVCLFSCKQKGVSTGETLGGTWYRCRGTWTLLPRIICTALIHFESPSQKSVVGWSSEWSFGEEGGEAVGLLQSRSLRVLHVRLLGRLMLGRGMGLMAVSCRSTHRPFGRQGGRESWGNV